MKRRGRLSFGFRAGIWGPTRLTKPRKLQSFRGAPERKTVKCPTFGRPSPMLKFECGASAEYRV
jgi:hypothetical protein